MHMTLLNSIDTNCFYWINNNQIVYCGNMASHYKFDIKHCGILTNIKNLALPETLKS